METTLELLKIVSEQLETTRLKLREISQSENQSGDFAQKFKEMVESCQEAEKEVVKSKTTLLKTLLELAQVAYKYRYYKIELFPGFDYKYIISKDEIVLETHYTWKCTFEEFASAPRLNLMYWVICDLIFSDLKDFVNSHPAGLTATCLKLHELRDKIFALTKFS